MSRRPDPPARAAVSAAPERTRGPGHPLAWLPAFLVGLSAVVAAEISLGLLLYTGPRLLRSLTLVLAILLGALALGLWTAPRPGSGHLVEAVRRRWLLALVSFAVAAATAGAWSALGGLASAPTARGLGLALLAGLPLFASGAALGAVAVARPGHGAAVAAPAAFGAATGAVFTGVVLVPSLMPVSMYVFCLVALSAGALIHGRVLDTRPEDRLVDEEPSLSGTVRVVERIWGSPRRRQRRLTVAGRLVGGTEDGAPLRPWEAAVAAWLPDRGTGSGRPPPRRPEASGATERDGAPPEATAGSAGAILLVGASAVALLGRLSEAGETVVVVERNPVLRRMAVRHFGSSDTADRVRVETGDPLDLSLDGVEQVRAVVLDGAGACCGGGVALPSAALLHRLRRLLSADGMLLMGGDDPDALGGEEAARTLRGRLEEAGFPRVAAFGDRGGGGPGRVVVVAGGAGAELPGRAPGMEALELTGHPPPGTVGDPDLGSAPRATVTGASGGDDAGGAR